jgi:hypothetical protein
MDFNTFKMNDANVDSSKDVRSFQVIACVLLHYDKCKNATYEQWFQDDINVRFNLCTMLIVEEMPKNQ